MALYENGKYKYAQQTQPEKKGLLESIGQFGVGALKGLGSTVYGAAKLGEKIGEAVLPQSLEKFGPQVGEKPSILEPQGTAQKAGFGTEQIAEWFVPAGAFVKGVSKADKAIQASKVGMKLAEGGKIAKTALTTARVGAKAGISASEGAFGTAIQSGGDIDEMRKSAMFAGAVPIVGKGLSVLKNVTVGGTSAARSLATGVPKDVFARAKANPQMIDDALKHIEENPNQPLYGLVTAVSNKLTGLKETARQTYDNAIEAARTNYPGTTFNLDNKISELNNTLNKFNIGISQVRDKAGKIGQAVVKPTTRTTPYTEQEISSINNLVQKMRVKDMSVDELADFQRSAQTFLADAINRDNKKMIALGAALVEDSVKFVNAALPDLKTANTLYSNYYKALESGGNKIIDNSGNIKPTAEQFLSNLQNLNKGEQREALKLLEDATGIPIADSVLINKDAQKLSNLFPATGSRTQDIIRAMGISGIGVAGGGLMTGGAAAAFSSPKIQGRIAIEAAKISKKFPTLPPEVKEFINLVTTAK